MPQENSRVGATYVSPGRYVRLRAFRQGYDDVRLGRPFDESIDPDDAIAYEHGRPVATMAKSHGAVLRPLYRTGKMSRSTGIALEMLVLGAGRDDKTISRLVVPGEPFPREPA